jgi:hypothetical protein
VTGQASEETLKKPGVPLRASNRLMPEAPGLRSPILEFFPLLRDRTVVSFVGSRLDDRRYESFSSI